MTMMMVVTMLAIVIFRINPESWIQFEEELGIERQLQIHSIFVKKKEGASIKIIILKTLQIAIFIANWCYSLI